MIIYHFPPLPFQEGGDQMLFFCEFILAVIIVVIRQYMKNKVKYRIGIKRIILKAMATALALLLAAIVILQELIQQELYKISKQEKRLKQEEKFDLKKRG